MAIKSLVELKYTKLIEYNRQRTAVFLEFDVGERAWFPLSVIEIDEDAKEITAPQSMVEDKGLEAYVV